jgi:hypothetical protein
LLFITSIGTHAGSIAVIAEQVNGWTYNGTFFVGDTITLGDFRITIKSINLDRQNPVELEYYQVIDLKPLLILSFFILTLILAFRVVNLGGVKPEEQNSGATQQKRGGSK